MTRLLLRWLLAFCALVLLGLPAWAHKPSDSYLTLRAEAGGDIAVRWDIALRDLDLLLDLDRDGNAELTWGEVRQRSADIHALAVKRLSLATGGSACGWDQPGPLQLDRHSDGSYAVLTLTARCPALTQAVNLRYSLLFEVDPTHRGLVQWQAPGATAVQARVFAADTAQQSLPLTAASAVDTLRQYLVDGTWHIWIGFDHILFLLSLLLPSVVRRHEGRWQAVEELRPALIDVLRVVTAFTVAHSITLSLAALQVVSLPSRWVESVIAASVALAALNNLRGSVTHRRWLVAFVFGLVHGFGFASVLADLGLPQGALALALVGFNVGVELGQLAIVAAFLPVAYLLRRTVLYRRGVLLGGSAAIALLATRWFVQRAFNV
jgi:hypothetical protein